MSEPSSSTLKVAHFSWWVCGLLGLLIGIAKADDNNGTGIMIFFGVSNGLFWGWILGLIIDTVRSSSTVKNIADKIDDFKEQQIVVRQTKISMDEYNDAKNRFQYLSNDTLVEKYQGYELHNKSDMTRLALEEELVKRGILDHSPMHEKLDKIKTAFKDVNNDNFK